MLKDNLPILFQKYINNTLTASELAELTAYLNTLSEQDFSDLVDATVEVKGNAEFDQETIFQEIVKQVPQQEKSILQRGVHFIFSHWKMVAAALLILGCSYILLQRNPQMAPRMAQHIAAQNNPTAPENMITLADGTHVDFAKLAADTIHHKGLILTRLSDGTLAINRKVEKELFNQDLHHQIVAPKGNTLKIKLPDESLVLLNSGSSMAMAVSYGRLNRHVTLQGEAFFEVTHLADIPFTVATKNTTVQVLGTTFNVSAYPQDKQVKTTLLTGSVHIQAGNKQLLLKPGQQAQVARDSQMELIKNVDINAVLAWREGYFKFKDESIQVILEELAKWYPITEIAIDPAIDEKFTGSLKRSKKLTDVLDGISQISALKFQFQEGRVHVMK